MNVNFSEKVILITGGGTGLGLGCARKYAETGARRIAIAGRRHGLLLEAKAALEGEWPGLTVLPLALDVRDRKGVARCVDEIVSVFGSLPHIVVNNAAGNFLSPAEQLSGRAWDSVVDIVLVGTVNVTMEIGRRWISLRRDCSPREMRQQPQVVFLAAGASYVGRGAPFVAPSAVAKGGVWHLQQSLAVEWGRFNMRFLMISPGPIYTPGAFGRLDPTGALRKMDERAELGGLVPLNRLGTIEEYAKCVAFVTSDEASWMTGTNIALDGGSSARGGEFCSGFQQIEVEMKKFVESFQSHAKEPSKL